MVWQDLEIQQQPKQPEQNIIVVREKHELVMETKQEQVQLAPC